jgi:chloramphenicol-sensitive protein RarD
MSQPSLHRVGLTYALSAYAVWGLFPLYFMALMPANPFEVVSFRVIFSLAFSAILVTITRSWSRLWAVIRNRRTFLLLGVAGILIFINWEIFILAVYQNKVIETSLGYFINPLITVALGVTVYRERLRLLQWMAVGLGLVAVVVLTFAYGQLPWIALTLAFSFGLYGFVKKRVGNRVGAVVGLAVETTWVMPIAIIQLVVVASFGGVSAFTLGPTHAILIVASGAMTAIPLMLFASGTKRIPLTWIGLIQYFTPLSSFMLGIFVFHEQMSSSRWVGFMIIWLALVFLTIDIFRSTRRGRSHSTEAEATAIGG